MLHVWKLLVAIDLESVYRSIYPVDLNWGSFILSAIHNSKTIKEFFFFIFMKHQTFIWFLSQNIFIFWQRKWSENYGFLKKPQVEFNLTEFKILYRERIFFLQRAKSFHRERNLSTVKSFIYLINTVIIYGTYCLFIDSLYQSKNYSLEWNHSFAKIYCSGVIVAVELGAAAESVVAGGS